MRYVLIGIIIVTVGLLLWVPHYLGPDDLASCDGPSTDTQCLPADAIVVLSGGDTNARTDEGIALFEKGWADLLIFSGAAADPKGPSNAEAMRMRALDHGVPDESIVTEELSRTTAENAANTSLYIEERSISRIILVTSGYHQRRSNLEFQHFLGENVEIVDHPVAADRHWQGVWWLNPEGIYLAIGELAKIGLFYLRGPA